MHQSLVREASNNMHQHSKEIEWAESLLSKRGHVFLQAAELVSTAAWSSVYRLTVPAGDVYLKIMPQSLCLEAKTMQLLHELCHAAIPPLLGVNAELQCFLTLSGGNISLREHLHDKIVPEDFANGVLAYTMMIRAVEEHIQRFLDIGVPDWGADSLPRAYQVLCDDEAYLQQDGLTDKEIVQLKVRVPVVAEESQRLTTFGIPESLVHCDLNDRNLLINTITTQICIIDWAEVVVAHPFYALANGLYRVRRRYQFSPDSAQYQQIRRYCIENWLDITDEAQLLAALTISEQLSGVFMALAYKRLQLAVLDAGGVIDGQLQGGVAGCLRTWLNVPY